MTRLPVAFIALTAFRWGFGLLAAIGGERTADIIGFFEAAARIAPDEALIAFARLYQFALGHGSAAQRWPLNSAMRRMIGRGMPINQSRPERMMHQRLSFLMK